MRCSRLDHNLPVSSPGNICSTAVKLFVFHSTQCCKSSQVTQCNVCIWWDAWVCLRRRKRAGTCVCWQRVTVLPASSLYLCNKEYQITWKCLSVCVVSCVCVKALCVCMVSETRCNVRNTEASRQAWIKYTHMDACTHKLNKTFSLSVLFISPSVTNDHNYINNPNGINIANHTHTHLHTKHINVTSCCDYAIQQVSVCVCVLCFTLRSF